MDMNCCSYFGKRLQFAVVKLVNVEPTIIGWSEITCTLAETLGPPGGETVSVGMSQLTIKVFNDEMARVLLPVWPG